VALAASATGSSLWATAESSRWRCRRERGRSIGRSGAPFQRVGFIPASGIRGHCHHENRLNRGSGQGREWADPFQTGQPPAQTVPYILSLIHGSLASVDIAETQRKLVELPQQGIRTNLGHKASANICRRHSHYFSKHVIYIIKENRT